MLKSFTCKTGALSSTDRVMASGAVDKGSIPLGRENLYYETLNYNIHFFNPAFFSRM